MEKTEEVVIESIAAGGAGVARLADGRVGFVHGVIDGERVRVGIDRASGSKQARLRLVAVLEPSPDRVDPPCDRYGACGGCDFMHMTRPAQVDRHVAIVRAAIERAVGACPPNFAHPLSEAGCLRSRARFALDRRGRIAFRAARSHELVPIERCMVLEEGLVACAREIAGYLADAARAGKLGAGAEIGVGFGRFEGTKVPVASVSLAEPPPASFFARIEEACRAGASGEPPRVAGVLVTIAGSRAPILVGDPRAAQGASDGVDVRLQAGGFAQASDEGARLLAERAVALARPEGARVLELFAGSGTLSVALARGAKSFMSVERSGEAVRCARENLAARGLEGTLREGDAEAMKIPAALDVVVLDPPRAGAPRAAAAIAEAKPKRVVYVSCDPATLGRDLATLAKAGYAPRAVETVELFAHTSHVETVVLAERGKKP